MFIERIDIIWKIINIAMSNKSFFVKVIFLKLSNSTSLKNLKSFFMYIPLINKLIVKIAIIIKMLKMIELF